MNFIPPFDLNEQFRFNVGLRYSTFSHVGPFTRYVNGNISQPDSTIQYEKGDLIKLDDRLPAVPMLCDKDDFDFSGHATREELLEYIIHHPYITIGIAIT